MHAKDNLNMKWLRRELILGKMEGGGAGIGGNQKKQQQIILKNALKINKEENESGEIDDTEGRTFSSQSMDQ